MDIPIEYIYRLGADEISRYFRELIMGKMAERKVAVMVKDYTDSLFFVECDIYGRPKMRYTRFLSFYDMPNLMNYEGTDPCVDQCKVMEKEIRIDRPLVMFKDGYNFLSETYVFMWEGEIVSRKERSLEELDVKQLLRLAQQSIKSRDGLIIDEVIKNRFIK